MIDTVQAILLFVIVLLTLLLFILGIQVFFILRDVRGTISRVNKILDNTETITEGITQPLNFLSGIFSSGGSVSAIAKIIKIIRSKD